MFLSVSSLPLLYYTLLPSKEAMTVPIWKIQDDVGLLERLGISTIPSVPTVQNEQFVKLLTQRFVTDISGRKAASLLMIPMEIRIKMTLLLFAGEDSLYRLERYKKQGLRPTEPEVDFWGRERPGKDPNRVFGFL